MPPSDSVITSNSLNIPISSRSIYSNKGSRMNTGRSNLSVRSNFSDSHSKVKRKVYRKKIPPLSNRSNLSCNENSLLLTQIDGISSRSNKNSSRNGVWLDRPSSRISYIGCNAKYRPLTAELMGRDGRTQTPPGGKFIKIPMLHSTIKLRRARAARPHHTFDLDGDGICGQEDIMNAKRFDTNCNGMMENDEGSDSFMRQGSSSKLGVNAFVLLLIASYSTLRS